MHLYDKIGILWNSPNTEFSIGRSVEDLDCMNGLRKKDRLSQKGEKNVFCSVIVLRSQTHTVTATTTYSIEFQQVSHQDICFQPKTPHLERGGWKRGGKTQNIEQNLAQYHSSLSIVTTKRNTCNKTSLTFKTFKTRGTRYM